MIRLRLGLPPAEGLAPRRGALAGRGACSSGSGGSDSQAETTPEAVAKADWRSAAGRGFSATDAILDFFERNPGDDR